MKSDNVSIIIPSRNDLYIVRTVESFFRHAEGEVDCIVFLDAWNLETTTKVNQDMVNRFNVQIETLHRMASKDPRLRIIEGGRQLTGQRRSINRMVKECAGPYFLKIDGHCFVSDNWDSRFKDVVDDDTLVVPVLAGIEEGKWEANKNRFNHAYIHSDICWKWWMAYNERTFECIDETMAFPGTICFGTKDLWQKIGGHNERWSAWGDCGAEISLKVWLTGHRLLITHHVCVAHLFRERFPYHITGGHRAMTRRGIREMTMKSQFPNQVHPIQWLVGKFEPVPSWEAGTLDRCIPEPNSSR